MLFFSLAAGGFAGIGLYTFIYAKGYSYISNDPAVCANCHIMQGHLDGWMKSTHRSVAVCNDCHLPESMIGKYYTKGRNGFWHSFYFTFGGFHEPIQATPLNQKVAEDNCRRCHGDIVDAIDGNHSGSQKLGCVRCHGTVGHP